MYHRQRRRSLGENRAVRNNAKDFGDVITMDHIDSDGELGVSLSGNSVALVVRGIAAGWLDGYPAGSKRAEDVVSALQNFVASTEKIGYVASEFASGFIKACKRFGCRHRTSTPGRPQTNGVAERAVREALEGTRAAMHQAGAPHRWWAKALRHYCFLYNVTKATNGEASPWEKRFGAPFTGPLIPFGAEISYKSVVADHNTSHGNKFGTSSRKGILVGYWVNPGGAWSKDYLVFDLDTIRQNKDARRIRVRRCGEIFQKRGLPTLPTKTMEAQVTPVPPADTAIMPEVLQRHRR